MNMYEEKKKKKPSVTPFYNTCFVLNYFMVCKCFQNESYSWESALCEVLQVHVSCDGLY